MQEILVHGVIVSTLAMEIVIWGVESELGYLT